MICGDSQWYEAMDAQGRSHKMANCTMHLVVGSKHEHIISFDLSVEKSKIDARKKELFAFVDQVMRPLGDAKLGIKIADELKSNVNEVRFNDIADQDPTFQKFVNKLATW
jgi:hypothetical protein